MTDTVAFLLEEAQPAVVTFDEYLQRFEGQRYEWVDGVAYPMTAINVRHEMFRDFLRDVLRSYLSLNPMGRVFGDPFTMKLGKVASARQPDLFVVLHSNPHPLQPLFFDGPADIVVEIASPGTEKVDRGDKFLEYERSGVQEYWRIDLGREDAQFNRLDEHGIYRVQPLEAGFYRTPLLPGLECQVTEWWSEDYPDLIAVVERVKSMWERYRSETK